MSRSQTLSLWAVLLATASVRIGFGAVLPVLPLYAGAHGMSTVMIAAMTNAYMISNALFQTYAGHLGDRLGRRPVMLAGILLYTASAALFLVDAGPWYYVALRGLEGLGASAFGPTVRAFVADLVPEAERGKAYAQLSAFDMAGVLFGPMVGGTAQSLAGPQAPFAVCALLGLLATIPMLLMERGRSSAAGTPAATPDDGAPDPAGIATAPRTEPSNWRLLRSRAFWAVSLPNLSFAYLNGLYSVAWSLYMTRAGASLWQVNLSFTVFAVPVVLLSVPFGRLADRLGRPLMVALGGLISTLVTAAYGQLPYAGALIALCLLDGTGTALFNPAAQAYMADVAPARIRGRFMGLVGTLFTAVTVLAVAGIGYLYEHITPGWLFGLGGLAMAAGCGSAVVLMLLNPVAEMRQELEEE